MEAVDTATTWHLSPVELAAGLDPIRRSPGNNGTLDCIVIRPQPDERLVLNAVELSPRLGVLGDRWAGTCSMRLPDGSPDPIVQVTLMNSRAIALFAQTRDRWALAGDQLFVDLDLSDDNLRPGQRLAIGSVILEVSDQPHLGCAKFAGRFGQAALALVNSAEGRRLHLRGINAAVVQAGKVKVGDGVVKC